MNARAEVLFVSGYAVFLVLIAGVLELAARFSHRRAQSTHIVGFTYHHRLDVWRCPNNQLLHRARITERGIVRYQAPAHQCNSCPIKDRCTDSDEGRVIEHRADSWFQSSLYSFHRAISISLFLLADLMLILEIIRNRETSVQIMLALGFLCISATGMRLLSGAARSREAN